MAEIRINVKTSFIIDPENGEKVEVMKITDFCRCVNKSHAQVKRLLDKGTKERKLKYISIAGKNFIPVSEVHEFPFETYGKNDSFYS